MLRSAIVCLAVLLISACVTPYQPMGYTGGYTDRRIGTDAYAVVFSGNGNTPRDLVFEYWLHRCAELTERAGFTYFEIVRTTPVSGISGARPLDNPDGEFIEVKGTGGGASSYYVVPGVAGTITRWRASGTIRMFNARPYGEQDDFFEAKTLLSSLSSVIQTGKAVGLLQKRPGLMADTPPSTSGGGQRQTAVTLDDLKDLLPEGK